MRRPPKLPGKIWESESAMPRSLGCGGGSQRDLQAIVYAKIKQTIFAKKKSF